MSTPRSRSPRSRLPKVLEGVRDDLSRLEAHLRHDAEIQHPALRQLLEWVLESGGKRMRPALVFAVSRLGDPAPEPVLALAAAVETLHTATLVHDDLVDSSLVRRGMPTLNTRWSAGATVLAGDWLFARAAGFAAATSNVRVMEIFSRTLGTMTAGELRQLFGRTGVPTREEYEYRIYAKTGSLFEAAAEAAGVLTVGDDAPVHALAHYGRELGMAFQIVDDILDFTGDEARLGKPVGSDLRAGTVTLPVLLHLASNPQAASWLDNRASEGEEIERLVGSVRGNKAALDAAHRAAQTRVDGAIAAIEALPASGARDYLARIARYVVERDY